MPTAFPHQGCFDASVAADLVSNFVQTAPVVAATIQDIESPITVEGFGYNSDAFTALSVNGAIPIGPPLVPGVFQITKGGVLADTLAAPVAVTDDGKQIYIFSTTANAHTVTATGLFQTGSASVNLATFAAFAGAGMLLMALNAKWVVLTSVGITFT